MPPMNGGLFRVTTVASMGTGITLENVFNISSNGGTVEEEGDIAEDLEGFMTVVYTTLLSVLHTSWTPIEVRVSDDTLHQPMPTQPWSIAGGSQASAPLPNGAAVLSIFRTPRTRCLGRKFWAGFTASALGSGPVGSGQVAAVAAACAALLAGHTGSLTGWDFVFNVKDKFNFYQPIEEAVVSNIWAYQRRRRPGRGV